MGSVIEMGIGTAAGLHLAAALPTLGYPSYLMGPLKYSQQITAEQIEIVDSAIAVPTGPGLESMKRRSDEWISAHSVSSPRQRDRSYART